jgi:hypothetical protein
MGEALGVLMGMGWGALNGVMGNLSGWGEGERTGMIYKEDKPVSFTPR